MHPEMWQGNMVPIDLIVTLITWIIIIALIILLVKLLSRLKDEPEDRITFDTEDPLFILKQRLARGEIDEESYDRIKRRLEED